MLVQGDALAANLDERDAIRSEPHRSFGKRETFGEDAGCTHDAEELATAP